MSARLLPLYSDAIIPVLGWQQKQHAVEISIGELQILALSAHGAARIEQADSLRNLGLWLLAVSEHLDQPIQH